MHPSPVLNKVKTHNNKIFQDSALSQLAASQPLHLSVLVFCPGWLESSTCLWVNHQTQVFGYQSHLRGTEPQRPDKTQLFLTYITVRKFLPATSGTSLVTRIWAQQTQFLLSHHVRNGSIITHLCLAEYNQVPKYQRRLHFIGLHILAYSYWVNISPLHGKAKSTFKRTTFDKIGNCCNACMWTGYFQCYWSRTTPRAS